MLSPQKTMILRSVRVGREHIGYFKWLLESHDGMATPTTRNGTMDVVDLMIAPDFIDDMEQLIDALVDELGLERIEAPELPPL